MIIIPQPLSGYIIVSFGGYDPIRQPVYRALEATKKVPCDGYDLYMVVRYLEATSIESILGEVIIPKENGLDEEVSMWLITIYEKCIRFYDTRDRISRRMIKSLQQKSSGYIDVGDQKSTPIGKIVHMPVIPS